MWVLFLWALVPAVACQTERRQLRTKPRNPFEDFVSPDEPGMAQGTDEFVYFFRKTGRRSEMLNVTVLQISEFRMFLHTGWQNNCGDWCGEYDDEVEDGISTHEGCCAVHALFIGSACKAAVEEDIANARLCFVFTTKEDFVTEHYIKKHVRKDGRSVHVAIAGGMLDAVGMVVAVSLLFLMTFHALHRNNFSL